MKNVGWMIGLFLLLSAALPTTAQAPGSVPGSAPVLDWPIKRLATGHRFTEGVAVLPNGAVSYSDIPMSEIHVYTPETGQTRVFRSETNRTNGQLWVPAAKQAAIGGQLLACEGGLGSRALVVYADHQDPSSRVVLADQCQGMRFNSPNDVAIWGNKILFTDPCYGDRSHMELPDESVYIIDPADKSVTRLNHPFVRPNGIVTSNDDRYVYIADHGARKLFVWDTTTPAEAPKIDLLSVIDSERGGTDGMCVDADGNIYATLPQMSLISVISPEGKEIGRLELPEGPTNCTLSLDGKTLYVTARKSLYEVQVMDLP